jgi:hypothetical protein
MKMYHEKKFYTFRLVAFVLLCMMPKYICGQQNQKVLRSGKKYEMYADRVEQKPYVAKALSREEITSNYQSEANLYIRPRIDFKFSINGKDNEMPSGLDHHFNCTGGASCETPVIVFGKQFNDTILILEGTFIKPDTRLRIRLDMRPVFEQFESKGYYETFNGQKLFRDDFKAVYVAGNIPPLTWDFDNLHNYKNLQLQDSDGDHIYELSLVLNRKEDKKVTSSSWKLSSDLSAFPKYESGYVLHDALYNLSLEEMIRAVEKDSTLRTGKEWAGVWTRDVSYSIILSMAILQNKVAQYSLLRKVKNGMVIQDTGTGGAYPISTDRMIWAVAAYEIYKVNGERKWLETVYPIIKKSLEADLLNAIDPVTGLVKGESSFLDWREQTYPLWMEPADIYESQCLGTNAVHFQAHTVLGKMALLVEDKVTAEKHSKVAAGIRDAMNKRLWVSEKGYYGQFLYGRRNKIVSPRSEALGEALCVLFDIADPARQKIITAQTPVNEFGVPCIYPQIPNIPPYHNNGIWPFVQSYWTMACAKAGNEKAVMESLAAIFRPTALFLTNKENFVAANGDFVGTQINSDNMLWSLSGNISMVYKVLFGMEFGASELIFRPFVPEALAGKRTLKDFQYRNSVLDIEVNGYGSEIKSFTLDGKALNKSVIPATLRGRHSIKIELQNQFSSTGNVLISPDLTSPETPALTLQGSLITWKKIDGATNYRIIYDGRKVGETKIESFQIPKAQFGEYQVIAISSAGTESFASEPMLYSNPATTQVIELEKTIQPSKRDYKGFSGTGFIETALTGNATISFSVTVPADGHYAIDFRYANGNGPINTENKCGIRGLELNGKQVGTIVLPHRGTNEWSDWGFTNSVSVQLPQGTHTFTLAYRPHHENMNGEINEAAIDYVRVIRTE